jgi:hypothetical protein
MIKAPTLENFGVNDATYNVYMSIYENGKTRILGRCNYYAKWADMIKRCYNQRELEKYPTYKGCIVCEEWRYFSNFIKWVNSQPNREWGQCHLDKDLLIKGNKIYSPETCVFVSPSINSFMLTTKRKTNTLIGVSLSKEGRYVATCRNQLCTEKNYCYLGTFGTELEAHKAWQAKKHEIACQLADLQGDPRVAQALRERYAPDKDWTDT